jgi:RNA polymerase sigma factor (sigma-70 family)
MIENPTDKELLTEVLNNGESLHEAMGMLFDRHYQPMVSWVSHRWGNAVDAEDIAQDTFLAFFENLLKHQPEIENVPAYLFRIAYNQSALHYRNHKRNPVEFIEDVRQDLERDHFEEPILDWDGEERIGVLLNFLQTHYPKCFGLLSKRYYWGWDFEMIAAEYGYSSGAVVRTLLTRCRKNILEDLGNNMEIQGLVADFLQA